MVEPIDVILGFDPGGQGRDGKGKFGWSICRIDACELWVLETGRAINAEDALKRVSFKLPANACVRASRIDAPMFWTNTAKRKVDTIIRNEGKGKKCPYSHDRTSKKLEGCPYPLTVQEINSLMGACIAQGVLLRRLLRGCQRFDAPITEAHPKALLCLLGRCRPDLGQIVRGTTAIKAPCKEDKEDAVLAAFAAWSMLKELRSPSQSPIWRDLLKEERREDLFFPFDTTVDVSADPLPVSYWMPIPKK